MRISFPEIETQHMAKEAPLTINHVFAGIAVADYDAALVWYTRFFGRSSDVIVTENESMWQVAETGWIYLVGDTNRPRKALITLLLTTIQDHFTHLIEQRRPTSPPDTVPT